MVWQHVPIVLYLENLYRLFGHSISSGDFSSWNTITTNLYITPFHLHQNISFSILFLCSLFHSLRVIYKLLRVISAAHRYCHSLRLIEQNFAVLLEETILDGAIINHSELCSLKLLNKHPLSVSVEAQDMSVICLLVSRKKSNSCSRS